MTKPHWSPSSLSLYLRCGEAWRRSYLEGQKVPPGVAAHQGRAIHATAQQNFGQKLETFRDLPKSDMVDFAVETFRDGASNGVMLSPEEQAIGFRGVVRDAIDETARMAEAHAALQAPAYQPDKEPERRMRIELPGPRDLLGIVDLTTTAAEVVDFKNVKRSKPQAEVDGDHQFTTYAAFYNQENGEFPKAIIVDQLLKRANGKIDRKVMTSIRTPEHVADLARMIDAADKAVAAGVFLPARYGVDWHCSPKWCGYFSTCPFVKAHRHGHKAETEE